MKYEIIEKFLYAERSILIDTSQASRSVTGDYTRYLTEAAAIKKVVGNAIRKEAELIFK